MSTSAATDYDFYDKHEYLAELVKRFDAARPESRILLMAMTFEPDEPEIVAVLEALERAAQRDVQAVFSVDARIFLDNNGRQSGIWYRPARITAPLLIHSKLPTQLDPPFDLKQAWLDRLQSAGVHVVVTNKPTRAFTLPISGRSHIKLAVVDDYVMIGGCNLDDPPKLDLMFCWQDRDDAERLFQLFTSVLAGADVRQGFEDKDYTAKLGNGVTLLIDAGVPSQSIIYENALELIDSAQEWLTITCQFFPAGRTATHLLAARKRGVDVKIYFTNLSKFFSLERSIQYVSHAIERSRLPREMFAGELSPSHEFLHTKLIASDAGMMIGSHNYVEAGVKLGTAEIALCSNSEELAKAANERLLQLLAE